MTETLDKNLQELDSIMDFDFTKQPQGEYEENAVVPDGWYWMRLVRIGKPYLSKGTNGNADTTKSVFEFVILGEADKRNQLVESEYAHGRIPAFININARKDNSTLYALTSALLKMDAKAYSEQYGAAKPSQLINLECWVRVETKVNDNGQAKSYLKEFKAELPVIQFSAGKGANIPANPGKPMPQGEAIPPKGAVKLPF